MSVLRYSLAELEGTLARLKSVDHIREDMEVSAWSRRSVGKGFSENPSKWHRSITLFHWLEVKEVHNFRPLTCAEEDSGDENS